MMPDLVRSFMGRIVFAAGLHMRNNWYNDGSVGPWEEVYGRHFFVSEEGHCLAGKCDANGQTGMDIFHAYFTIFHPYFYFNDSGLLSLFARHEKGETAGLFQVANGLACKIAWQHQQKSCASQFDSLPRKSTLEQSVLKCAPPWG